MGRSITSGPLAVQTQETDGSIWMPAHEAKFFVGTWTATRTAAGDINMLHTDADDTSIVSFDLTSKLLGKVGTDPTASIGKSHDIRGIELNSIDVVWKATTTALDAFTYDLTACTYVDGVAPAVVTTPGGTLTGTLTLTAAATPRRERITLGTPYVIGANTALVNTTLELSINAAATSVVTLYGVFLNVHYNLH